MKKIGIVLSFALIMTAQVVYAENFAGNWLVTANGWPIELSIEQNNNEITGTMRVIGGGFPDSTILGEVQGRKITFTRYCTCLDTPQDYLGYLYMQGGGQGMAGIFSHNSNWEYGWEAESLP